MCIGDHVYFYNFDVYFNVVVGGWNGENVIILGDDLYFGYLFGIMFLVYIIKQLNSVLDFVIEELQFVYFGGFVYWLDGVFLWVIVVVYLVQNGGVDSGNVDVVVVDNIGEVDNIVEVDNIGEIVFFVEVDIIGEIDIFVDEDDGGEIDDVVGVCMDVLLGFDYLCEQ